jgi:large subunit ribosomal protein L35
MVLVRKISSNSIPDERANASIAPTGDMNKPIYRFLANREWRTYKRKILMQRITQMGVIPDVLPQIDPIMEVRLAFGRKNVQPGDKVNSSWSEQAPTLTIQPFEKGEKLVTVVVVDSDVPDLDKDGFDYRCHGIFTNIPINPTTTKVSLAQLPETQVPMTWVPPTAQKGSPYHRLSIWVLEQPEGKTVDVALAKKTFERDGFVLRSFLDKVRIAWGNKAAFKPVGITMFRTEWDESMEGVMQRAGIEEWDVEFKRKRVEPLPYRKKDGARYRGG